jgi:hypothetical protein
MFVNPVTMPKKRVNNFPVVRDLPGWFWVQNQQNYNKQALSETKYSYQVTTMQ